jgi:hypothetical protein
VHQKTCTTTSGKNKNYAGQKLATFSFTKSTVRHGKLIDEWIKEEKLHN